MGCFKAFSTMLGLQNSLNTCKLLLLLLVGVAAVLAAFYFIASTSFHLPLKQPSQ